MKNPQKILEHFLLPFYSCVLLVSIILMLYQLDMYLIYGRKMVNLNLLIVSSILALLVPFTFKIRKLYFHLLLLFVLLLVVVFSFF
ncbi:hypothetical protein ACFSKL_09385 [Belliella marina]|uniref:Uncharacterized protein n=1 Tax=Belliella marina TaxID=1644146 RepID=A0ABW4VM35_9BACT